MSSRIEQLIGEIEEYIGNCRFQPLSNTKIVVNKEEIDELLRELRMKMPDEIKHYQRIISNKEEILNDAKAKAEDLIKRATVHTTELVNEHEIMRQAYDQANEIVTMATKQAQGILDHATTEANNMRYAAMQYTDDMLVHLEKLIVSSTNAAANHYENLVSSMNQYRDIILSNRRELHPAEEIEEDSLGSPAEKTGIDVISR
ncbi:MAG: vacuolar family H+-ATPase subunit H [Clostridium sp.]|jgi:cell division septum initiation protein DivIVA|nr:vacuolar family H+-ATPase subunit H [Clostridium sp.]